jgi:hypothetical protein
LCVLSYCEGDFMFLVITPCCMLGGYWYSTEPASCIVSSTLNMKGAGSFKMPVIAYVSMSWHAPEDCSLHFTAVKIFRSSYMILHKH